MSDSAAPRAPLARPAAAPPRAWLGRLWSVGRLAESPLRTLRSGLLIAALSVGVAVWALKLWQGSLALPLRYAAIDDSKFYLMLVKGIIDHGWYETNASLGAPFGQQLHDYPQGADNLNFLIIRFLALFSSNPALVMNLFLLATFALVGSSAYLVIRRLGVGVLAAGLCALLFVSLPYHFFRGESHLLLSAYYSVPLAAWLFLSVLSERPLLARRSRARPRVLAWASGRSLATVLACVVIGSDSLYYATFAVVLLIAAGLALAVVRRRLRAGAPGILAAALIALTVTANLSPALLYSARHGENRQVARSAALDESHGLKLTNLVLPAPTHRIPAFRHFAGTYDNAVTPIYCEACYASLGTVGTVGLGWLALSALGGLLGAGAWYGGRRLFRHSALGAGVALAVASIGGVSSLLEFYVTPNIRGWNRISVFIAFFSLLAVGLLLTSLGGWLRARRGGRLLYPALVLAVLAWGLYDQTSDFFVPSYGSIAQEYHSDARFVSAIEARLPPGSSVLQLPYVPFPEGYIFPTTSSSSDISTSYELIRGYLHSHSLRWSYGAMKGRPADWSAQLAAKPLALAVPAAAAAGFSGIWLDPRGYPGSESQTEQELASLTGAAPLWSPDRDLVFYDLRAYRQRLAASHPAPQLRALSSAALDPVVAACVSHGVRVVNRSSAPRPGVLRLQLAAQFGQAATVRVQVPKGAATQAAVGPAGTVVRAPAVFPPGASTVAVTAASGAAPLVTAATFVDDAYRPFEPPVTTGTALLTGMTPPPCSA